MATDQIDQKARQTNMATGALSHLIGAYYLLGGLICDCNPQEDKEMRQILLHLKGLYWSILFKRYGIVNPKKENPSLKTKELPEVSNRPTA